MFWLDTSCDSLNPWSTFSYFKKLLGIHLEFFFLTHNITLCTLTDKSFDINLSQTFVTKKLHLRKNKKIYIHWLLKRKYLNAKHKAVFDSEDKVKLCSKRGRNVQMDIVKIWKYKFNLTLRSFLKLSALL